MLEKKKLCAMQKKKSKIYVFQSVKIYMSTT